MTDQELEERVQRAVDNFMAGYGCCQSVVAAFADLYGLDDTLAKKVAAGFGGGVGRLRMMCGGCFRHRHVSWPRLRTDGRQRPRREVGVL